MSKKNSNCIEQTVVNQLIRAQAQVTIKPVIKQGKPKVYCLDSDIKPNYVREESPEAYYPPLKECTKPSNKCTFTLTQLLCVEVPINIDVDVDVDEGIIQCGRPRLGPCNPRNPRHKELDCEDESE